MTTPKTIRVKRKYAKGNQFVSADGMCELILCNRESDELDITITIPKSLKQRRREARLARLESKVAELGPWLAVNIIEQVDAEFDREREAERRHELLLVIRQNEGLEQETIDAIEATYRGER